MIPVKTTAEVSGGTPAERMAEALEKNRKKNPTGIPGPTHGGLHESPGINYFK